MQSLFKMRDRRNTSLSVSSTSSTSPTPAGPSRDSLNEKTQPSPPPLSPTLPPPVTKENRPKPRRRRWMTARALIFFGGVLMLWRCYFGVPSLFALRHDEDGETLEHDLDGGNSLPDEPTALIVSDGLRRPKWTVSIPHSASFPLQAQYYKDICVEGGHLRDQLVKDSRPAWLDNRRRGSSYYAVDESFLDIAEAEGTGALPPLRPAAATDVCERSLTFSMETDHASFGKTLLLLWMSYGLAKQEGRAFFIDDTRWPYGRFTSYFQPPPDPKCSPPPPHAILPCPHQARHLLVSAATAEWTFGSAFNDAFVHPRRAGSVKNRRAYDLIHKGYEDLFRLVGEDASYAQARADGLKEEAKSRGGSVVGVQIRRGDLHPYEYQFSRDYLPLERYSNGARSLLRLFPSDSPGRGNVSDDTKSGHHFPLLIASDDPDLFNSPELAEAAAPFTIQKVQERILLATKATLDKTSPVQDVREPGSAYVKHIDENAGWEGGFYSALFYSLGNAQSSSGSGTAERHTYLSQTGSAGGDSLSESAMRMRQLVGRAYLIDLAVLGQSRGVVCAVSSAACRILGVMLGWDAVREGRWVNVDDGRPWSWDGRR